MKKVYTKEFKFEAITLADKLKSVAEAERQLGGGLLYMDQPCHLVFLSFKKCNNAPVYSA